MRSTGPPPEVIHGAAADMGFTCCPHCRRTRHRQAATPVMPTVDLPLAHARSQFETTTRAMSGPDSASNGAGVIGSPATILASIHTPCHAHASIRAIRRVLERYSCLDRRPAPTAASMGWATNSCQYEQCLLVRTYHPLHTFFIGPTPSHHARQLSYPPRPDVLAHITVVTKCTYTTTECPPKVNNMFHYIWK